jgi:predicted membrane channel-forming protein YqfA (hemolysin III family)
VSQTVELIIRATIIVTVTNIIEYVHLKQNPDHLTLPFFLAVSLVTVVPLAINIWWVLEREAGRGKLPLVAWLVLGGVVLVWMGVLIFNLRNR